MAQRISKKLAQRIKVLSYFYCLQLSLTCQFYVGPKGHCLPDHPQVQTSSWLTVRADSCVRSCLFESICSVAMKLKANVLVFPGHLLTLLEIFFSLDMLIVALLLISIHCRSSLHNLCLDIMTPMVVSWLPAQMCYWGLCCSLL